MAKIGRKPTGIYYLDVLIPDGDGGTKRCRVSCDTRDPQEAERQRREWMIGTHLKHFSRGVTVAPKQRPAAPDGSVSRKVRAGLTMGKLLAMCESDPDCWKNAKAQATIRSNVNLLTARIGDELVADMTHKRLCALRDTMLAEGYAPASVKRKLDMVSKALRMAEEVYEDASGAPLLASKPRMPKIEIRNNKNRTLSDREETLVFAALDAIIAEGSHNWPGSAWSRFRAMIRVALDTGFRKGELLILGPQSVFTLAVDGEPATFVGLPQYQTKNDKPRMVPATPAVAALIPSLDALAVPDKRTGERRWFPIGTLVQSMMVHLRAKVKELGGNIDDVGLHTLRHTCITRLALGGMELQRLSMWAGHSDVSITASRYSHLSAQALAMGAAILSNPAAPATPLPFPDPSVIRNGSVTEGDRAGVGTVTLQ